MEEYILSLEGWKHGLQQDVVLARLVHLVYLFSVVCVCVSVCMCYICVFVCMCVCVFVCVCYVCVCRSEDSSHEKVLSFHHVDYRDQTQIPRLASKLLCLLYSRF